MSISDFIKQHPVSSYFFMVFVISWGGILVMIGPEGFPGSDAQIERLVPLVFLAMIAGPSIAGILLTGIADGRQGIREFFARQCRWRVNIAWYSMALLITPLLLITILAALTLISPVFVPGIFTVSDRTTLLAFSIMLGLAAGFFEEIGWTGFAIPKIQLQHSALSTGLMLGVIWAIWHLLADLWGSFGMYGGLYFSHFLLWVVALPAYRILMVWVYNNTESLLIAQLMHASFSGSQFLFSPSAVSIVDSVLWYAVFAFSLWVITVVVISIYGAQRLVRAAPEVN